MLTSRVVLRLTFGMAVGLLTAAAIGQSPTGGLMPSYGQWTSSRIGGGGYAQNVVTCPSNPQRFYAYIDVGGLYRSDDGGKQWRMLHGALPAVHSNYSVRSLLVDPRDDNRLIIAVGNRWDGRTDGIFLSDDAGETWRASSQQMDFDGNGSLRATGVVLARDPFQLDTVFAAAQASGLWRSRDNGQTWENLGLTGVDFSDIKLDSTQPGRLWVCVAKLEGRRHEPQPGDVTPGLYRSVDGGATFERLLEDTVSELIQDPTQPDRLYGIYNSAGIQVSHDAGVTWRDLNDGLAFDPARRSSTNGYGYRALGTGPDFILTVSTNGTAYRLTPGDTTWRKIERENLDYGTTAIRRGWGWAAGSIVVNPHDPAHWFMTDYMGVSQTFDAGRNWHVTADGIEITVIHAVCQDPTDPGVVHLGMADNGYFQSIDGGVTFRRHPFPQDAITSKDIDLSPKLPSRVYSIGPRLWDGHIRQVYVSIDRGQTWERSPMLGLPDLTRRMCTSLAVDPNEPYTVYLAVSGEVEPNGGGPYRSTDGGKSWTWIGQGLPEGKPFFWPMQWAQGRQLTVGIDGSIIAISRSQRQAYRLEASGDTWVRCAQAITADPVSVAADWLTPGRFFIAVRRQGIFRTQDSGRSWEHVWTQSATHIMTDKAVAHRVACSTGDGVVLSVDGGDTWIVLDRSLPDRVYGNMPAFIGDRLVIGSNGSGAFWIPLSPEGQQPVTAGQATVATIPESMRQVPEPVRLVNPSMAEGDATPRGWSRWPSNSPVTLARDTQQFKSAPASLVLTNTSDELAKGHAVQDVNAAPGTYDVAASVRVSGTQVRNAQLALQTFDANWNQLEWIILAYCRDARDWRRVTATVNIPPNAVRSKLIFLYEGDAQAWLDDVSMTPQVSEVFP